MASPLSVWGVGGSRHETSEFVILQMYLPGQKNGQQVLTSVKREVHIVDDLRAKMLIGNAIIGPAPNLLLVLSSTPHLTV